MEKSTVRRLLLYYWVGTLVLEESVTLSPYCPRSVGTSVTEYEGPTLYYMAPVLYFYKLFLSKLFTYTLTSVQDTTPHTCTQSGVQRTTVKFLKQVRKEEFST